MSTDLSPTARAFVPGLNAAARAFVPGLNAAAKVFVPAGGLKQPQTASSIDEKVTTVYEKSVESPPVLPPSYSKSFKAQDSLDYKELMQALNEEAFRGYEEALELSMPPNIESSNPINQQLELAADYAAVLSILNRNSEGLEAKNVRKSMEVLLNLYKASRIKPPSDVLQKMRDLVFARLGAFARYELRGFIDAFQRLEGRDSSAASAIVKHIIPREHYFTHLNPRRGNLSYMHLMDDLSMESLQRFNGLYCPKCREDFFENPNFSLVEANVNYVEKFARASELDSFKATIKPINFSEVKRWTQELICCIEADNWQNIENAIALLLQNGGRISSHIMNMARSSSCSYKVMQALIKTTKKATLEDFRLAFEKGYPLDMLSFMISHLSGIGSESPDAVLTLALECQCSLDVVQLLVEAGAKMTHLSIKRALQHSPSDVLDFAIASYGNGKLCPSQDLPYVGMEFLPKERWDYVFSKLENPFEDYSMDRILHHFLSLSISGCPIYPELVQFFLDKGGYIPTRSVQRILMAALPPSLKLKLLDRWIGEGGVVTADLIEFALTPKSSQIQCKNTLEIIQDLFTHWTIDQEKIPELLKTAVRWSDLVDFIKTLMDLSSNLEFIEEFLGHKKAQEIVEYFLSKEGKISSQVIPRILHSDLSPALKLKIVQYWLDRGGEVTYEILSYALSSASYRNLHEVVDYLLPFWNVDPLKISDLIKEASCGDASTFVVKHFIDLYENPKFIVELLHHKSSLELIQHLCSKGVEVSSDMVISALKYPGHVYVGGIFPDSVKPWLLKGKDAKLWLINEWTKGEPIVSQNMMQLAVDCRNAPEVINCLQSLKKEEGPDIAVVQNEFSEMKIQKPVAVNSSGAAAVKSSSNVTVKSSSDFMKSDNPSGFSSTLSGNSQSFMQENKHLRKGAFGRPPKK